MDRYGGDNDPTFQICSSASDGVRAAANVARVERLLPLAGLIVGVVTGALAGHATAAMPPSVRHSAAVGASAVSRWDSPGPPAERSRRRARRRDAAGSSSRLPAS